MIPRTLDEKARLGALRNYQLLDTQAEEDFDLLTELAAELCGAPYSFVSLVDEDRVWFKSCFGSQAVQAPRDESYCSWAVLENAEMIITDLHADQRQIHSDMTDPFRMYTGVSLTTPDGYRIGMLCVLDTQPRRLSERQLILLRGLARQVVALMELRRLDRELKTSLITVSRLANEDGLTGLKNRRAWLEEAQQQFQLSKRLLTPFSVLMLDVDHFKAVNDTHGHPAGDAVLRALGNLLLLCVRNTDTPGRLGGEEFAVLIPGTDAKGALQIAETLRNAIGQERIEDGALTLQVTVSIGVASVHLPPVELDFDTVMRAVDQALYRAKQNGRNRVEAADPAQLEAQGVASLGAAAH
jgi:diguanylate cyclase (GGDEF)-like protein